MATTQDDPVTIDTVPLVGGHVAMDFANTASDWTNGAPGTERLRSYADLVTFAVRTDLLGDSIRGELLADAAARPADAERTHGRALVLRKCLHRVFTAIANGERPEDADVAKLNSFLTEGMCNRRLERDARCCGWSWSAGEEPLARMLWPIAHAAADLLVSGDLDRVKTCGNDRCGWLFVDQSRNRSRRWCEMKDCGNRAKARRHYARHKGS